MKSLPPFDELAQFIRAEHPDYQVDNRRRQRKRNGRALLLSGNDEVEVALIERNPVTDGSIGQDEIAEFIEDIQDCKPKSGVQWLEEYLASVRTIYSFQHLQGSETVKAVTHSMPCAQSCGNEETLSCKPTAKDSRMRRAITSSGSSPTRSQDPGTWACFRTASGVTSQWIWAIPIIELLS